MKSAKENIREPGGTAVDSLVRGPAAIGLESKDVLSRMVPEKDLFICLVDQLNGINV